MISPTLRVSQISQRVEGRGNLRRVATSTGSAPKITWVNIPSVIKWMRSQRTPLNQGNSSKLISEASSAANTATNR